MAAQTAVMDLAVAEDTPRLDRFLAQQLPAWSRTQLQVLIRSGAIAVNGAACTRASHALSVGDTVRLVPAELPSLEPAKLAAEPIALEILYEDEDMAVLNKPAGLLVHPGAGQTTGTLANALLHRYGALSTLGGEARPGIVHRLDRSTSGVMVVARNDFAHRKLVRMFQARQVEKRYLALAHGLFAAGEGEITLPIGRDLQHRKRMTTRRPEAHSRAAHSSYRVLEQLRPPAGTPPAQRAACSYAWIEVRIHTGRTHQIRVHLAALGHPLVGDRLYGATRALAGPGTPAGVEPERVMLHAAELALAHPRTGAPLRFSAPLPQALEGLLAKLRQAASQS